MDRRDQGPSKDTQEAPIPRIVTFRLKALLCREGDRKERPRFKAMSPQRRLLTDHGPVGDVELVAVQHGLAAELL